MSSPTDTTETERERDYLEVDDPIPGQNYTCLSFVSPEEVIKDRTLFMTNAFLKTVAKNYDLDEDSILEKYKDFLFINEDKLVDEYAKKNDFQTSVRGLKVRGVYDTLPEAQRRAKLLQKTDPNFNVFVGQVGYWLPWDPAPHKVSKQEYAEKELNELIHKYEENQEARKTTFNKRVEREMEEAKRKSEAVKKENAKLKEAAEEDTDSKQAAAEPENVLDKVMEEDDAWSKKLKENSSKDTTEEDDKDKDKTE